MLAVNDDCCRENLCLPLGTLRFSTLSGNGWLIPASQVRGWQAS